MIDDLEKKWDKQYPNNTLSIFRVLLSVGDNRGKNGSDS